VVELRAPGLDVEALGAGRWHLPGLAADVQVDAPVAGVDVVEIDGDVVVRVRHVRTDGPVTWRLELLDADAS
jgi:hypothetical protein